MCLHLSIATKDHHRRRNRQKGYIKEKWMDKAVRVRCMQRDGCRILCSRHHQHDNEPVCYAMSNVHIIRVHGLPSERGTGSERTREMDWLRDKSRTQNNNNSWWDFHRVNCETISPFDHLRNKSESTNSWNGPYISSRASTLKCIVICIIHIYDWTLPSQQD